MIDVLCVVYVGYGYLQRLSLCISAPVVWFGSGEDDNRDREYMQSTRVQEYMCQLR